jgi:hypothetical protein
MAKTLRAKSPADAVPAKPKIGIFGASGVGKTWGAIDFPDAYLIDAENGANQPHYVEKLKKAGAGYWGASDGAGEFSMVVDEMVALATTEHSYKTVVVDSLTKLFNSKVALDNETMTRAGKDVSFGKDKQGAVALMRRMIRWFDSLDMNVVLINHERAKWVDAKADGYTYDGWDKLIYELNLMLRITIVDGKRKATVVKSRFEQFPENSIFDWSYNNFANIFGRDILEGKVKTAQLADDDQIREYVHLTNVFKVPETTAAKWAEVELTDMTFDALQKRIDWIKQQIEKGSK